MDGLNVFRYLRVNYRYWSVYLAKKDSNTIEGIDMCFVHQKYLERSPLNNYSNRYFPEVRMTFATRSGDAVLRGNIHAEFISADPVM